MAKIRGNPPKSGAQRINKRRCQTCRNSERTEKSHPSKHVCEVVTRTVTHARALGRARVFSRPLLRKRLLSCSGLRHPWRRLFLFRSKRASMPASRSPSVAPAGSIVPPPQPLARPSMASIGLASSARLRFVAASSPSVARLKAFSAAHTFPSATALAAKRHRAKIRAASMPPAAHCRGG